MNNFTENIYYQKAQKIKPRKFIYLFIFFLISFISQLIFVYLVFIPNTLNHYEKDQTAQEHIQMFLERIANLSVFWAIMFLVFLVTMIYYAWNIQKLIESINNSLNKKQVLSMNSFTENIYYKRAKKMKPRGYLFLFIISLIGIVTQLILVYLLFIPKILNHYEKVQVVQEHIRMALVRISSFSIFWQIMFLALLWILLYYVQNTKKLINNIDNYSITL